MVLRQKRVQCLLGVWEAVLPQVKELSISSDLITNEGMK